MKTIIPKTIIARPNFDTFSAAQKMEKWFGNRFKISSDFSYSHVSITLDISKRSKYAIHSKSVNLFLKQFIFQLKIVTVLRQCSGFGHNPMLLCFWVSQYLSKLSKPGAQDCSQLKSLTAWLGRVAQSVGHLIRKSGVLRSIPGLATYFRFSFRLFKKGSCQLLAKVCARSTG